MSLSREELIFMSKIAEQTERFEDMLDYMKKVVMTGQELSIEERNLLSVAYKNSVGSRRTAWRALSSIEQKEESKGSKNLNLLKDYKKKIETELTNFCNDVLSLIDSHLVKTATNSESKVFFMKMKGDYFRYISEYATGDLHKKASENASSAYKAASDVANAELKTTHPIRLGLALNYSVFFYEVLNDASKACNLAKQAFDDAIADIEHIEEDQYKDATTIMQLIRDNLTLWTSEMQDDAEGDGTNVENFLLQKPMYNSPSSYSAYNYPTQSVSKPLNESDIKFSNFGGLTDIAGAKAIAKRIFEMYDRDRDGNINNMEVVPMMVDAYQGMNRRFQPTKQDIDSFYKVCDRNRDGRVNYEDVETLCIKYLTTGYMKEEISNYK